MCYNNKIMQDMLKKIGDKPYLTTYGSIEQFINGKEVLTDITELLNKPSVVPDIIIFCNYRVMMFFGYCIDYLEKEYGTKIEWEVDNLNNTIVKLRLPAPVTITFLATKMENNYLMVGLDKDKTPIYGIMRINLASSSLI